MKKTKLILFILLLIFFIPLYSCKDKNIDYDKEFNKIKVGQNEEQVISIMGEDFDKEEFYTGTTSDSDIVAYRVYYWFNGNVKTKDEAGKLYQEKHIYTKYYCVIFSTTDLETYVISSSEDIISGNWGMK